MGGCLGRNMSSMDPETSSLLRSVSPAPPAQLSEPAPTGSKNASKNSKSKRKLAEERNAVDKQLDDSGVHSRSERFFSSKLPDHFPRVNNQKGKELQEKLKDARRWKARFREPTQDFLGMMDRLFMECQEYLTFMSTKGDKNSKSEADALVEEMIALRNDWGPQLLPVNVCNAFVRERIPITVSLQQYRIDCAQFFEPVPFYNKNQGKAGKALKLYRFSVYDLTKNEVVLRYYLERNNSGQLHHNLCCTTGTRKTDIHSYGTECPTYWETRQHMMNDVLNRFKNGL